MPNYTQPLTSFVVPRITAITHTHSCVENTPPSVYSRVYVYSHVQYSVYLYIYKVGNTKQRGIKKTMCPVSVCSRMYYFSNQ